LIRRRRCYVFDYSCSLLNLFKVPSIPNKILFKVTSHIHRLTLVENCIIFCHSAAFNAFCNSAHLKTLSWLGVKDKAPFWFSFPPKTACKSPSFLLIQIQGGWGKLCLWGHFSAKLIPLEISSISWLAIHSLSWWFPNWYSSWNLSSKMCGNSTVLEQEV
jgi:hypothetical protein